MLEPSLRVLPVAPVFFDRSDPARSTRLSLEFRLVSLVTPSLSSSVVFFSTFGFSQEPRKQRLQKLIVTRRDAVVDVLQSLLLSNSLLNRVGMRIKPERPRSP